MSVLYFISLAHGNAPQVTLHCFGRLNWIPYVDLPPEIALLAGRTNRVIRLDIESDTQRLGLTVRRLVNSEVLRVVWTDSEHIKHALRPDPDHINLVWCVRRFREDNHGMWETFQEAHGSCATASNNFLYFLREKRVISHAQLELGYKVARGDELVQPDAVGVYEGPYARAAQGYHAYVFFGRIGIDWTYRQIDADCKIPHIFRLPEGHRFPRPGIDYDPRQFYSWNPTEEEY